MLPDIIQDSLCVGKSIPGADEQVVLFVKPKPGVIFTEKTEKMLRDRISTLLSPRHVPRHFYSVRKIPYNVNGKKLEVAVKRILAGAKIDAKTRATLADPHDLDDFKQYAAGLPLRTKL